MKTDVLHTTGTYYKMLK